MADVYAPGFGLAGSFDILDTLSSPWAIAWRVFRAPPEWATKLIWAWLRWFWRLSTPMKIAATGAEIVALWFAVPHFPLEDAWHSAIFEFGSLGLCFFLLAGVLFSRPGRR